MMDKIKNNPVIAITVAILLGVLSLKLLVEHSTKKIAAVETANVQAALAAIKAQSLPAANIKGASVTPSRNDRGTAAAIALAQKQQANRNIASATKATKPAAQPLKSTLAASNRLLASAAPARRTIKPEPMVKTTGYTALPSRGTIPSNHNVPVGSSFETSHDLKPGEIASLERELASSPRPIAKNVQRAKKKTYASKTN